MKVDYDLCVNLDNRFIMTSDPVNTNISSPTLTDRNADESWELLKREFNTLFSNLKTDSKEEGNFTDNKGVIAKKPIVLQDNDDSDFTQNQGKVATATSTTNDRSFKRTLGSIEMKKRYVKKNCQAKFVFNTLEGKEVCSKILQHTLGLLSLLLLTRKIRLLNFSSKLRLVIQQLSLFRYYLRFGNFAINLYKIIKRFRWLREMKKLHYKDQSILFYFKNFRFFDIIEAFYNLTDELILFHKLQSMFGKKNTSHANTNRLMTFVKKQHYILWEVLNILAINKNIEQWRQLIRDEIYLSIYNTSGNAIKEHELKYKLPTNDKVNLELRKNNITLDFYKIILNLLSNLINIKGKRDKYNLELAYEIISVGSGVTELLKLWNQAKVTSANEHTSAV